MKNGSLETIIRDMIRRLESTGRGQQKDKKARDVFRELETFAAADPVLADLHKDYVDANSRYRVLAEQSGFNDPMSEIAADLLDSARSAVQTRLIELQEVREQEVRDAMALKVRRKKAADEAEYVRVLIKKRKEKMQEEDLAFWVMMVNWIISQTLWAAQRRLSAANDFALVSMRRERAAA